MEWLLMIFAFAATVMLVLSLSPAVVAQWDSDNKDDGLSVLRTQKRKNKIKKTLFPLIFFFVVLTALLAFQLDAVVILLVTLGLTLLFTLLLFKVLDNRRRKQEMFFEERMLDFLVLVCNNLKSGFALPNSIEFSAKSIGGVLGAEFNIMLSEYRLGMELGEAIRRMNSRINSENLQLFAATVSIAIRTGGSISNVLERLVVTIRKRNDIADKLKSMTGQFNFEATVMAFFPLLAFIVIYFIDPKLMRPMVTTGIGWATIAFIVILELIGLQILKKICNIKL